MLLAELVETWDRVRSTRSRLAKIEELATRLGRLEGTEIEIGTAFLAGEPRQGKLGVGYRTLH
ncbi:MAG TPA: ATP-dependent DNA ligase, partial [Acidimicrobiia bacterium]